MSYQVNNHCILCGTCQEECSENAIHEETDKFIINQDFCIECGECADICPVDAIEKIG